MKLFKRSFANKIVLPCLILMTVPLFSAYRQSRIKENESVLPSLVLLRPVSGDKYVVDKIESLVKWKGTMQIGSMG
ncbi:MAG: hypothetical protein ABIS36_01315 [Chryseolinea sp.]